jgi:hypothetical protein
VYRFASLDPRSDARSQAANALALAHRPVYGIKLPSALAARCDINLTPARGAAIEAALIAPLPPDGATFAILRPDVDALGAIAILVMRADGTSITKPVRDRIRAVARAAFLGQGWGPDLDPLVVSDYEALQVMAFDHRRTLVDRVAAVRVWLETGSVRGLERAAQQVRRDRAEQLALDRQVELVADGRIAVLETASRFGYVVASRHADIVIVDNPVFSGEGGRAHRKVTVRQVRPGLVDLAGACAELARLEPGWRASLTVIVSPRGSSTNLARDVVVQVVARYRLT